MPKLQLKCFSSKCVCKVQFVNSFKCMCSWFEYILKQFTSLANLIVENLMKQSQWIKNAKRKIPSGSGGNWFKYLARFSFIGVGLISPKALERFSIQRTYFFLPTLSPTILSDFSLPKYSIRNDFFIELNRFKLI